MIWGDIRELRGYRGLCDILVGSPPCQDLSCANRNARGLEGPQSGLWFEALRLVGEIRPHWGCFECSATLRVRGYDRLKPILEAYGYACWPRVVGADGAGAPHERDRLWLIFADPHEAELEVGEGEREDPLEEQQTAERGRLAPVGHRWGPISVPDLLDDGLPSGVARRWIEAYGDAVVPQVALEVFRAMGSMYPHASTVVDLFAGGAGGWSLAAQWAGLEVVGHCEVDPWRQEQLRRHFG